MDKVSIENEQQSIISDGSPYFSGLSANIESPTDLSIPEEPVTKTVHDNKIDEDQNYMAQKVEDLVHAETINDSIFNKDFLPQIDAIIMLAGHATVRPTPLPAKMHAELPYIAVCRAEITEHERKKMTAACTRCMRTNLDHAQN